MRDHLIVLAVASLVTLGATPFVRLLAFRVGAVAKPDERRVHAVPTPNIGGLAMYLGFVAGLLTAWQLPTYDNIFRSSSEPLGVFVAATIMVVVGYLDDVRDVSAPAKVAGQVLAASGLYFLGLTMFYFRVPFGDVWVVSPEWQPLVTAIWVVAMANAVNLVDGLDGLAAGLVGIASAAVFIYGTLLRDNGTLSADNIGPLIALLTVGICLGFLPHNFHPARIFMGDSGSLLLGLLIAASTIVIAGRANDQLLAEDGLISPILIPFLVMGVALLDLILAVVRRLVRRVSLATPDRDHLHYRLLRLGHTHRRAVAIMWGWTAVLSGLILVPAFEFSSAYTTEAKVLVLILALYTLGVPLLRRVRRRGKSHDEPSSTPESVQ